MLLPQVDWVPSAEHSSNFEAGLLLSNSIWGEEWYVN